jgi:hypothetical protein
VTEVALPPEANLAPLMRQKVAALQSALMELPQYQPETKHYFHGGMYCREVYRAAGVLVVGAVHRKEHFYEIVRGRVLVTDGTNEPQEFCAPALILSKPGTKRAVLSLEPTLCRTFHATNAKTVEEAEAELVESEPSSYAPGNVLKTEVIK